MKVVTMFYLRRVNLGNYEHEEFSMSAACEVADEKEVLANASLLKSMVLAAVYNGDTTAIMEKKSDAPAVVKEEEPQVLPSTKKVKKADEDKSIVAEAKPTKEKKKKNTNIPYNRELKAHTVEFAKILDEKVCPGWQNQDWSKTLAKVVSKMLNGEDMYDSAGNILDVFVDKVRAGMEDGEGK